MILDHIKSFKKPLFWTSIWLVLTFMLSFVFQKSPSIYENLYLNGLFSFIRSTYDTLIGSWLPLPMLWLVILVLIVVIFYPLKNKSIFHFLLRFIVILAWIFILFKFLWGFNYSQVSIQKRAFLKTITMDSTTLVKEFQWTVNQVNQLRQNLQNDSLALKPIDLTNIEIENEIRLSLVTTLDRLNFPTAGSPRIRVLKPKGILMRAKTAGIYIPHTFEGHIDGGLLNIEYPFTIAHEMSHGYGITDEGACNFTGFLACMFSERAGFQYSALIDYSLYLRRDLYQLDKNLYHSLLNQFHPGYHADIQAIRDNGKKYPDILPGLRDLFYDHYLKSQGVSAGLDSYSEMVQNVIAYKRQFGLSK